MADIIRLKKGLDIPVSGACEEAAVKDVNVGLYGIVPADFPGYTWRLLVKPGDRVKVGTALLEDKEKCGIRVVAPVAGEVMEVRRGERRAIQAITIRKDGEQECEKFDGGTVVEKLCACGLWAMMRQRPYDVIPNPSVAPRDIFVTAFDTAPLACDLMEGVLPQDLEEGLKQLSQLTQGKVRVGVRFGAGFSSKYAEVTEFRGPHPAGNVGVQIANIKPVNKGEAVWALDARTVARIGRFLASGELDFSTVVAETGDGIAKPCKLRTTIGASMAELLKGALKQDGDKLRVISGNVLTGIAVNAADGFLRYPYRQITAIAEGDNADEFMGWASLNPAKYSVKRSFPAFLKGKGHGFGFDARIKGGHRAMILSGEYDKVFPMDIYPEYLLKAILSRDIDRMEKLGIYEVAPEDFALAEFVDTSKQPLQQIVQDGIDYMRKEVG